jgi:hypothetical protein
MASRTPRKRKPAKKAPPAVPPDFGSVFSGLRGLLKPYARRMAVKFDGPGIYYLESKASNRYGEEVFFGAVRTGKRYVSYHFMPVYVFPALVGALSPALKKRMQGKACFNFTSVDRVLFKELGELTRRGFEQFERGGVFGK